MIKHRKLFPISKDNTTLSCPDICDPACPYGCDTYTGVYSVPPPPPQASPSLSAKRSEHISPFLIVIITLLASCSIVIAYYFIMVKFCSRWKPFRPWQRQPEASNEEFLDEIHGQPAIDHPIWYINTIGLQPSVIDSITIFRYKKGDDLIEGTECSVCLNEFQHDDTLRLLPKCSHAFHIPCIDTWLRSHINCPVCRAGIVSTIVTGTPLASNGLNSNHMILDEDSPVENSENEEDLNINRVRNDETSENRTDTVEIIEFPHVDNDELGDKRMPERENNEMQPVKRSISVDSFLAANISDDVINLSLAGSKDISLDQIVDLERVSTMSSIGGYSRTGRNVDGRSSIAQFLHKSPVRMKRSSSYAAGRSFLSRQRTRTNSLLPL